MTADNDHRARTGPGAWPSPRLICVLLLLFATALAAAFWVKTVRANFDAPHGLSYEGNSRYGAQNFDFLQYYAGGHNWRLGLDPYRNHPGDPRAILLPRVGDFSITGYIYPPTFLPAYAALSRLAYGAARVVWLALGLVALAGSIATAALVARGRRLAVVTVAVLLVVASYPFVLHVYQGQADLIVAGLTVTAFLLYPRGRGWPTAVLMALGIATKLTPVLLLAVLVLYYRDWRLLARSVIAGAVLLVATGLFTGFELYREFLLDIMPRISTPQASVVNQTVLRYLSGHAALSHAVSILGYAVLLLLVWLTGSARRAAGAAAAHDWLVTQRDAVLALSVAFMLFFSPLAWQMAYVWMIVPLALLLTAPAVVGQSARVLWLGLGAALVSVRVFDTRFLDMLNVLGLGIVIVTILACCLPLGTRENTADRRGGSLTTCRFPGRSHPSPRSQTRSEADDAGRT